MSQDRKTEAQTWIAALERALRGRNSNDVLVPYAQAAMAFPSANPHPYTFDYPIIDGAAIKTWAESNGWNVSIAQEKAPMGQEHSFPIRLTKRSPCETIWQS
jgi:hypothetical protein